MANRSLTLDRRTLAPDLARGVMLLVIALAHTHLFTVLIGGPDRSGSTADRLATAGTVMLVDLRGYPMFAALFGYGLAQIHRRLGDPWPRARGMIRRRGLWLIAFGLAHVVLLFPADILTVYGLTAVLLAGALRLRDRTLIVWAALWLPVTTAVHALVAADDAMTGDGLPRLSDGLGFRLSLFSAIAVMMLISTVVPFLAGILASRHRLLGKPRPLRAIAAVGIPLSVLGGLPLALDKAGVWTGVTPADVMLATALHQATGYAGGLGYAALIALLALRLDHRRGPVVDALAALGERSLTFYLAQSLAWALLFSSYALHLRLTSPAVAVLVALAVWLATVLLADLMRRRDIRGPAETALRHLTYAHARDR
ncbi:DUF418 domain-containing protein [Paractinoplanes lichenicola]|uniref:DUF418 domain-containing protein n=1 Tax=Paractinoplanes lichenicola TaxID=2802976 RepID=A0ABS1VM95_9ACTN|nr:DUF418 domain-containing protein [Actinoplanes lichenicola]MBL7255783.1 DUF418 domain-containing protein [Actinoplanes lichenicola]